MPEHDFRSPRLFVDAPLGPGQTVALVGHTGSGKTTIAALLQKLYLPVSGRVLIDGFNILDITSDSLRAQMGSVQQNNYLFAGSVLENIRFARPQASEAQILEVLRSLDCLDMIESLDDGLNHQVGEKSSALSMGQRQLVCFARAMLADPRIVVLDEATSAIDTMTERRLQHALEALLRGRTAFVVAHRLSTIQHADCIFVFHKGRLREQGPHQELLSQRGINYGLYQLQYKEQELHLPQEANSGASISPLRRTTSSRPRGRPDVLIGTPNALAASG